MTRPPLMPTDTPDYMADAWVGCMSWAITADDSLAAFRAETGNNWTPGKAGIEAMVDKATGADRAFIAWANVNVWGNMDGEELDGE